MSLKYRNFKQDVSLFETNGYEHLVVESLAFLQVYLCGISTGPFISIG